MKIVEYLIPGRAPLFWQTFKQVGIDEVVSELDRTVEGIHDATGDRPWDYVPLARMKEQYEAAGLRLIGLEDWPPMDKARTGRPGRDEEIDQFCKLIENMGKLDIPILAYNWMAVVNWARTRTAIPTRGGALVTGFKLSDLEGAPLTKEGEVQAEELWSAFEYFIKRVVPVAEKAGVRLALHPDDPPLPSIRGVARIMTSIEALERALNVVDSEANSLCVCQGNYALMTDDVPGAIRHFGRDGKVAFVHFRDVEGDAADFVETFHDLSPHDPAAAMRAWHEVGYEGYMRVDHVPTLVGEENDVPGYGHLGRLHAIGYLQGLRDATAPK